MNKTIDLFVKQQANLERAARLVSPITEAMRENSTLWRLIEDEERRRDLMRAAVAPLNGLLANSGLMDPESPYHCQIARIQELTSCYEQHFRVLREGETAQLLAQMAQDTVAGKMERYHLQASQLERAMEEMRSPWLDVDDAVYSARGFAGLQNMGHMLRALPAFGDELTGELRSGLGDWRNPITWPESIFDDLITRSEFYASQGLDPALTDFPPRAFKEGLGLAQLNSRRPKLVVLYSSHFTTSEDADEEAGFVRTNDAHDCLQRLETQIRKFIDRVMTDEFGPNWARKQLPNNLYDEWNEKKQRAEQAGASGLPIIAYADFTDYEKVIFRRDNWRQVFQRFFRRQESLKESLQRLYPIRICTMHARMITQEDELLLIVESERIMKAVGAESEDNE